MPSPAPHFGRLLWIMAIAALEDKREPLQESIT
jgi:hypothetical protein